MRCLQDGSSGRGRQLRERFGARATPAGVRLPGGFSGPGGQRRAAKPTKHSQCPALGCRAPQEAQGLFPVRWGRRLSRVCQGWAGPRHRMGLLTTKGTRRAPPGLRSVGWCRHRFHGWCVDRRNTLAICSISVPSSIRLLAWIRVSVSDAPLESRPVDLALLPLPTGLLPGTCAN
jgi:hypothetical protein